MTVRGAGTVVGVCAVMLALGGCAAATSKIELVPPPSTRPAPAASAAAAPSEEQIAGHETAAAGTLRSLAAAQTTFVVRCFVDQDGDGAGEYGCLRELCGSAIVRGRSRTLAPGEMFPGAMGKVNKLGIVTKTGYCYIVYLPTNAGPAISGDAGAGPVADPLNADAQETRWCAYAWPKEYGVTGRRVFVINQQAEVNVASNQRPDGKPLYSGDGTNAGDVIPKPGAALVPSDGREQDLDGDLIPAGARFQSTVVSSHRGSDGQEWSLPRR